MKTLNEIDDMVKNATCLYNAKEVEQAINCVATELNDEFEATDQQPLFLCVMNGALIFMGQLLTKLNFPLQADYIQVASYHGGTKSGQLNWIAKPQTSLKNRNVIIVDDILDTGSTLAAIVNYCHHEQAKSVRTIVLIDKNCPRAENGLKKADIVGLKTENKFLIGYGLDYQGFLRNLPGIYAVKTD